MAQEPQKRPIVALQLYTLRDLAAQDMAGVLRQVAEMGYEGVELAGYGNLSAPQIQSTLQELAVTVVATHTGFAALQDDFQKVVEENQALGNQFVVCPSIPAEQRTADGYREFARTLTDLGARLRDEAGLQLCYHNHAFEFEDQFGGQHGFDLLYENSDPQLVQAEIDTYWVQKGGANPTETIRKYSGRAPLIHIKDMSEDGDFAEIGTGVLDWPSIFHAAEAGGATAYIVEQDTCPGNPLDSVRLSLENLKKMGKL